MDKLIKAIGTINDYNEIKKRALIISKYADDGKHFSYEEWCDIAIIDAVCHVKCVDMESGYYGDSSISQESASFPAELLCMDDVQLNGWINVQKAKKEKAAEEKRLAWDQKLLARQKAEYLELKTKFEGK